MKKPAWVVDKERSKKAQASTPLWLFGLHAVRDALVNPARQKQRLVLTRNALDKVRDAVAASGMTPEIADPRKFPVPLDAGAVHQGAALEVLPLGWPSVHDIAVSAGAGGRVVLLDRVSDPHNAGAVLRSAAVFGAAAVIGPARHSAPESGALAKTASGALERQPYLKVRNLGDTMEELKSLGYLMLGLDGLGEVALENAVKGQRDRPIAIVLGAEGPGLRQRTRSLCDQLVRLDTGGGFGSLNVSNAAAVALYELSRD